MIDRAKHGEIRLVHEHGPTGVTIKATMFVDPGLVLMPDIRSTITRRRAEAVAAADAHGIPRRPLNELVREFDETDRKRLRGDR